MIRKFVIFLSVLAACSCLTAVNQVLGHLAIYYPQQIVVRDTLAFIGNDYEGLRIIDISDPAQPQQTALIPQTFGKGFDVADTLLYYSVQVGVRVYNIADPSNPQLIMTNVNASCEQMTIYGDYYISNINLSVYNRWTTEVRLWYYDFDFPYGVNDFIIQDSLLFASVGNLGFMIFDFSDPEQPQLLSTVQTNMPYFTCIAVHNDIFYYMQNDSGDLKLYDVSDPANPYLITTHNMEPMTDMVISEADEKLICYAYNYGIRIYDISDPLNLQQVNQFGITDWYFDGGRRYKIRPQNRLLCVMDNLGLRTVQMNQSPDPTLLNTVQTGWKTYGLDWHQDYLYASEYSLEMYNLANPALPVLAGSEPWVWEPNFQVRAGNGFGILRTRSYGKEDIGWMRYVNATDPSAPYQMGTFWQNYSDILDMDVENNYLYIESDHHLLTVDFSNTSSLYLVGDFNNGSVERFDVHGNLAYLCLGTGGVKIVNVSNPAQPSDLSHFYLPQPAVACQTNGSVLAVMASPQTTSYLEHYSPTQIYLIDVTNPAQPVLGALIQTGINNHFSNKMRIYGNVLILCDMVWNRIYLYDISDYTNPVLLQEIVSNTNSAEAVLRGDYLYSADGYYGIAVRDVGAVLNDENITPIPSALTVNCSPNPFRDIIKIRLNTHDKAPAHVCIYNLKGQLIHKALLTERMEYEWNGKDSEGLESASGVYIIKVDQDQKQAAGKIIKLR